MTASMSDSRYNPPVYRRKVKNEATDALGRFYSRVPKAVLAAMVVDLVYQMSGNDQISDDAVVEYLRCLWDNLHANGVVVQMAPRKKIVKGVL
jgi:hypothetical protein